MAHGYNDVDEYAKRALEIIRLLVAKEVTNYDDREDQDDDIEGLKVKILHWSAKFHHTQLIHITYHAFAKAPTYYDNQ